MTCEHWKHLAGEANRKMLAMEREMAAMKAMTVYEPGDHAATVDATGESRVWVVSALGRWVEVLEVGDDAGVQ